MILFAEMRIRFGAKQVDSTHQQFVFFLHSLVDVISKAIHVSSNAVDVSSNAVDVNSNGGKQFLSFYMSPVHYFLHTIEPLHQGKDGRLSIGDIIAELLR